MFTHRSSKIHTFSPSLKGLQKLLPHGEYSFRSGALQTCILDGAISLGGKGVVVHGLDIVVVISHQLSFGSNINQR